MADIHTKIVFADVDTNSVINAERNGKRRKRLAGVLFGMNAISYMMSTTDAELDECIPMASMVLSF